MQVGGRAPGIGAAALVLAVYAAIAGCLQSGDERFRAEVVPVMAAAAKLDSELVAPLQPLPQYWAAADSAPTTDETYGARVWGNAKVFRLAVDRLPLPRGPALAQLRAELAAFGESSEQLADARTRARRCMLPVGVPSTSVMGLLQAVHESAVWEGACRARHESAVLSLVVAEEVVLGTGIVGEEHRKVVLNTNKSSDPQWPQWSWPVWPDSVLAATRARIRWQIKAKANRP